MDLDLELKPRPSRECPYCMAALGDIRVRCPGCDAAYHPACLDELGRCGTLGCPEAKRRSRSRRAAPEPEPTPQPRPRPPRRPEPQPPLWLFLATILGTAVALAAAFAVFVEEVGPGDDKFWEIVTIGPVLLIVAAVASPPIGPGILLAICWLTAKAYGLVASGREPSPPPRRALARERDAPDESEEPDKP